MGNIGIPFCWGNNGNGQLGDGTSGTGTNKNKPVQVDQTTGLTNVVAVAGGAFHSLALKKDGTVWAWGYNDEGQLGDGTNNNSNKPVQVDQTNGLTNVVAVAGGAFHSLAIKNDGTVWAWGKNSEGQLGDGTNNNSNKPVQVDQAMGLTNVVAIAGGGQHSLALKKDGTVWAWGYNFNGQLGDGTNNNSNIPVQVNQTTGLTNVVAIAGGYMHSLALRYDGTVWAWGNNGGGELGDGTSGPGNDKNKPVQVDQTTGLTNVVAIAGGNSHSLALTSNGTVWAWGYNFNGELGDGTNNDSNKPVQVDQTTGLTNVVAVAGGGYHSLAFTSNGTVWAWGDNFFGELGDGTSGPGTNSNKPVQVDQTTGLTNAIAIAGGRWHSLAISSPRQPSRGISWLFS